ncbi:MAG: hypothetical protein KTR31_25590 [Myxococcales bacterium]|nr:hypothetical protein [Myxococcales bacterium]
MSDAYQPPATPPSGSSGGQAVLGVLLLGISAVCGSIATLRFLGAVATLAAAWGDLHMGSWLCVLSEVALSIGLFGGGAIASFEGGRALIWPATHGMEVRAKAVLWEIHEAQGLASRQLPDPGPYEHASARDLADVASNIDAAAHPERYRQLLAAIRAKVAEPDL